MEEYHEVGQSEAAKLGVAAKYHHFTVRYMSKKRHSGTGSDKKEGNNWL